MNDEKINVGLGGILMVYVVLSLLSAIKSVILIVTDFSISTLNIDVVVSSLMLAFLFVCLMLIFKRSKHAILCNRILLVLTIGLSVYYMLSIEPNYQVPLPIIGMRLIVEIFTLVVPMFFLGYWFFSKRVKHTFLQKEITSENINGPILVEDTSIKSAIIYLLFSTSILFGAGTFIFTGFGALFYLPVAVIFSVSYLSSMIAIFNKFRTPLSTVFWIGLAIALGLISIMLNVGIVTDGDTAYLLPEIMSIPENIFIPLFRLLSGISFLFFALSVAGSVFLAKKPNKVATLGLVLIWVVLIGVHVGSVLIHAPDLRKEIEEKKEQKKQEKAGEIEKSYLFDALKIKQGTLVDRKYAIFTPPNIPQSSDLSKCPYVVSILSDILKNDPKGVYSFDCLHDNMKSIYTLPVTKTDQISFSLNNSEKWLMKGDILSFTVKMPLNTYVWVNAMGNPAKDCPCRMSPYDYQGIDEYISVGTSTKYHEQSLIQHHVMDRERVVTVLYPINADAIPAVIFRLSQFANLPDVPVTLIEIAVIKSKYVEPVWLKEWFKRINSYPKK